LDLGEIEIAKGGPKREMGENRESYLLVEHVCLRSDDVAELRVTPHTHRAANVDATRPVTTTVIPECAEGPRAPTSEPEVFPPIAGNEVAVEAAVAEVAGHPRGDAECSAVDRTALNPEGVVANVTEIMRRDPADPPRLIHRQGEVGAIRSLDNHG